MMHCLASSRQTAHSGGWRRKRRRAMTFRPSSKMTKMHKKRTKHSRQQRANKPPLSLVVANYLSRSSRSFSPLLLSWPFFPQRRRWCLSLPVLAKSPLHLFFSLKLASLSTRFTTPLIDSSLNKTKPPLRKMSSTARNRLFKIAKNLSNVNKPSPQMREAAKKTRWDILRGDKVQVIGNHPEKGKQGIVLQVIRKKDRVLVEGVNMAKKNIKGDKDRGIPGRTIMTERTIHYSKVNLVDPLTGVPTRVTRQFLDDGSKVRVAKKSGAIIPRPDILTFRKRPVNSIVTESCTAEDDAWEITYADYESVTPSPTNA